MYNANFILLMSGNICMLGGLKYVGLALVWVPVSALAGVALEVL